MFDYRWDIWPIVRLFCCLEQNHFDVFFVYVWLNLWNEQILHHNDLKKKKESLRHLVKNIF